MTITMTNETTHASTEVEKSALDIAVKLAKKWQKEVVIYKAEIVQGQGKKVLSVLKTLFDKSPMRDKLEVIAILDAEGNFAD